jgi:hypothetical protein
MVERKNAVMLKLFLIIQCFWATCFKTNLWQSHSNFVALPN